MTFDVDDSDDDTSHTSDVGIHIYFCDRCRKVYTGPEDEMDCCPDCDG